MSSKELSFRRWSPGCSGPTHLHPGLEGGVPSSGSEPTAPTSGGGSGLTQPRKVGSDSSLQAPASSMLSCLSGSVLPLLRQEIGLSHTPPPRVTQSRNSGTVRVKGDFYPPTLGAQISAWYTSVVNSSDQSSIRQSQSCGSLKWHQPPTSASCSSSSH